MAIQDLLWDFLDSIKLADFFDRYNIPPIVMPAIIVLLFIAALLILANPQATSLVSLCGNNFCEASENEISCPVDCNPDLREVENSNYSTKTSQSNLEPKLTVNFFDASDNSPMDDMIVSMAELENGKIKGYLFQGDISGPTKTISLQPQKDYALFVEKDGYYDHDGRVDPIKTSQNETIVKNIFLTPLTDSGAVEPHASLTFCMSNLSPIYHPGKLAISSFSGILYAQDLSLLSAEGGCYTLSDLPPGKMLFVQHYPDSSCISKPPMEIVLKPDQKNILREDLNCPGPTNVGYFSAKVIGRNGGVITPDVLLFLKDSAGEQISGQGSGGSLLFSQKGYTEEITVPANEPVYLELADLPADVSTKRVREFVIGSKEHTRVTIYLDYEPINTSGTEVAELFFDTLTSPAEVLPGERFNVVINRITAGDEKIDYSNINLTANIAGKECSAIFSGVWEVTCVAPDSPGDYEIVLSAKYLGDNQTHVLPISVTDGIDSKENFRIIPLTPTGDELPLIFTYDITEEDRPVEGLVDFGFNITNRNLPSKDAGRITLIKYQKQMSAWDIGMNVFFNGDYRVIFSLSAPTSKGIFHGRYYLDFHYGDLIPTIIESPGEICWIYNGDAVCIDLPSDVAALPGDLNDNGIYDDYDHMAAEKLMTAPSAALSDYTTIMGSEDFNQDGRIDEGDLDCLSQFEDSLAQARAGSANPPTIDSDCVSILDLGCGQKGDMNSDKKITTRDYVILYMASEDILDINPERYPCVDVNSDGRFDDKDLVCLNGQLTGESTPYGC